MDEEFIQDWLEWNLRLQQEFRLTLKGSAVRMSYFTKLMRIPSHHFDQPQQKQQRSRSLDVEALERSGIKMLRVVNVSCDLNSENETVVLIDLLFLSVEGRPATPTTASRSKWVPVHTKSLSCGWIHIRLIDRVLVAALSQVELHGIIEVSSGTKLKMGQPGKLIRTFWLSLFKTTAEVANH